jgi:hypothetical protein
VNVTGDRVQRGAGRRRRGSARGLAYEAIQNVGEDKFRQAAIEEAQAHVTQDLALWAEIKTVGYLARKPG